MMSDADVDLGCIGTKRDEVQTGPLRPFLPAWLDDLGLTAQQFRVVLHLWRWARTRCGMKPCTSSIETITSTCRLAENTVWRCIRALENRGLVRRVKRFRRPNEYHLQLPASITAKEGVNISPQTAMLLTTANEGVTNHRKRGGGRGLVLGKRRREGNTAPSLPFMLPANLSDAEVQSLAEGFNLGGGAVQRLYAEFCAVKGAWIAKDFPGLSRAGVPDALASYLRHDSRGKKALKDARGAAMKEDLWQSEPSWAWREQMASLPEWCQEYTERAWVSLPDALKQIIHRGGSNAA